MYVRCALDTGHDHILEASCSNSCIVGKCMGVYKYCCGGPVQALLLLWEKLLAYAWETDYHRDLCVLAACYCSVSRAPLQEHVVQQPWQTTLLRLTQ
jgi:hypothetical protein